jgi:excisionase family DNA binding protein
VADDDEILLVSQVADEFSVTEQTVRAWLHSGKLKGRRVGKAYRILRSDVLAMLEAAPSGERGQDGGLWERDAPALEVSSESRRSGQKQVWLSADTPSPPLIPAGE